MTPYIRTQINQHLHRSLIVNTLVFKFVSRSTFCLQCTPIIYSHFKFIFNNYTLLCPPLQLNLLLLSSSSFSSYFSSLSSHAVYPFLYLVNENNECTKNWLLLLLLCAQDVIALHANTCLAGGCVCACVCARVQ